MVTNLDYYMVWDPICLDNEDKEGDNLSGNHLINVQILTTNVEKVLVFRKCSYEKALQMKLEEEIYQENFINYVETYYDLTQNNESKGIR